MCFPSIPYLCFPLEAIEESLLDRLNELSKLAPDIGKLKAVLILSFLCHFLFFIGFQCF